METPNVCVQQHKTLVALKSFEQCHGNATPNLHQHKSFWWWFIKGLRAGPFGNKGIENAGIFLDASEGAFPKSKTF